MTLSFNLAQGASLGQAVDAVAAAERDIGLPATISGSYSGDAAEFQKSLASEPWLILAAVVVIYIVLGVLYESVIHPVTILSTLPSAGIGALLALMAVGSDLSLVALVGLVLLMGIVKKNAIMMVDFAIEAERERGIAPRAAIEEAGLLRFRPIMMTTMAALLGALAAGARPRHRQRAAVSARRDHRRRVAAEPASYALHDAGDLSGVRAAAAARGRAAAGGGGVELHWRRQAGVRPAVTAPPAPERMTACDPFQTCAACCQRRVSWPRAASLLLGNPCMFRSRGCSYKIKQRSKHSYLQKYFIECYDIDFC